MRRFGLDAAPCHQRFLGLTAVRGFGGFRLCGLCNGLPRCRLGFSLGRRLGGGYLGSRSRPTGRITNRLRTSGSRGRPRSSRSVEWVGSGCRRLINGAGSWIDVSRQQDADPSAAPAGQALELVSSDDIGGLAATTDMPQRLPGHRGSGRAAPPEPACHPVHSCSVFAFPCGTAHRWFGPGIGGLDRLFARTSRRSIPGHSTRPDQVASGMSSPW